MGVEGFSSNVSIQYFVLLAIIRWGSLVPRPSPRAKSKKRKAEEGLGDSLTCLQLPAGMYAESCEMLIISILVTAVSSVNQHKQNELR